MTKLGWGILIGIVVVVGGFLSLLSFGTGGRFLPSVKFEPTTTVPIDADGPPAFTVPVAGYPRGAITDSWGDARGGGTRGHHGTDILAPAKTPVVAAAPGTVEKLFQSELGGTTLYVRSPDRRWTYYYAHLSGYAPGVREGMRVNAGDPIAFVGDTGDAGPGNYHLHFGLTRMRPEERWWQGEDVNPYPYLAGKAPSR